MSNAAAMGASAILDFHTHPWRPEDLAPGTVEFIRRISPALRLHGERLHDPLYAADVLRAQHVEHAVLLAEHCPRSSGNVRTETVLELCRASCGFFLPFASVDPNTDADARSLLQRYVDEGVAGLKLYPSYQHWYPNDERAYPLYEICERAGLPVLFHIGSSVIPGTRMKYCDPVHLDDLAVDFPRLNVVMAHGGRGFWYDACGFLAAHHPNFYIDVTGLVPERLLEHFPALERISHKVVFGSDWPAMPRSPAENAETIRGLGLSADAVQRILYGNAAVLLGLSRRTDAVPRPEEAGH